MFGNKVPAATAVHNLPHFCKSKIRAECQLRQRYNVDIIAKELPSYSGVLTLKNLLSFIPADCWLQTDAAVNSWGGTLEQLSCAQGWLLGVDMNDTRNFLLCSFQRVSTAAIV